ncbi:glycosyltransferase family 4 protein [Aurantimonas sp. A3-2-R12]|uniref:glycosyltransferase family 4 protein n=1 Tax=Aurantimonas sp. A3-2-R12 TaxID=3114362 RepID=UPI002E18EFDE|nr:glycosyltransferase family 4 protein [Aurantimonas sp. A3-2-R12]
MTTVLVFNRFYLPGYEAGGPIVSLANLFTALGDTILFRLVTTDRDITDSQQYRSVSPGVWTPVGKASVLYLAPSEISIRSIARAADQSIHVLYLNSFFDTRFTARVLLARRLGRLPQTRLVLAPRGEFSAGALGLKSRKKYAYMAALKASGLLAGIEWHASTPFEAEEIVSALGPDVAQKVRTAPDLGAMPDDSTITTWHPRKAGDPLRICFLSRISPMKNLVGAINALAHMHAPAHLTVYGPVQDKAYWEECQRAAEHLPAHIGFVHSGTLPRTEIHATLARHDAFFLPTLGENYGHVIPEALSVGLPVVISDCTPWRGLAGKGVGYDGPLDDQAFARELDRLAGLDGDALGAVRRACRNYARIVLTDPKSVEANRLLFRP